MSEIVAEPLRREALEPASQDITSDNMMEYEVIVRIPPKRKPIKLAITQTRKAIPKISVFPIIFLRA
ncbi:MAG: hypothetical protein IT210_04280 [Armatimonadetes bacterium]|nr:hypothetical protein [Armatimonadota bacterium]